MSEVLEHFREDPEGEFSGDRGLRLALCVLTLFFSGRDVSLGG